MSSISILRYFRRYRASSRKISDRVYDEIVNPDSAAAARNSE
jgi:hypothetical protein